MIGWKPLSHDPNVASARLRCLIPLALLRRQGRAVELFEASRESSYTAVIFQKTYDPESLSAARRIKARGAKIVFDLCDNTFYSLGVARPDETRLRGLEAMTALADVLTVSTEELARHIPPGCSAPQIIRDGLEQPRPWVRWRRAMKSSNPAALRLGWFGVASGSDGQTGVAALGNLAPLLNRLGRSRRLYLDVFSNTRPEVERACSELTFPWTFHPWRGTARFNWDYTAVDITLLPVTPTPFSVCKSNNRLALSLLLGVPAIADSIPSYAEFKDVAFLDRWEEGLARYAADSDLRQEHARRGREIVESQHMAVNAAAEWASLLDKLERGSGR